MSSKNKKDQIPLVPHWAKQGHSKPVTRREFLAAGMIPFTASLIVPNWMKLLLPSEQTAWAQSCPTAGSDLIPFICVDLAGGAGLQANFLPHTVDLQLLSSYSKMGMGSPTGLTIERAFGNVPFAGLDNGALISKWLTGFRNRAAVAEAKTAFVGVCMSSQDDTSSNLISPMGMVEKAGLLGSQLPGLGTEDSLTGGRHKPAVVPPSSPLVVKSFNDIKNTLGYGNALNNQLNKNQKLGLSKLVSKLNETQSRKLASMANGDQVKTLLDCAGIKNTDILNTGGGPIDPSIDAKVSGLWDMNNGTQKTFASIAYNAIQGQAGGATISLGGYDYHDNARTTTDQKDLEAGEIVGRIVATAEALQKRVFIFVTTDGSVGTDSLDRTAQWSGDRGQASMGYIVYYDPTKRADTSSFQIGQYTNEQISDPTALSSTAEVASTAVFANWLKLNNRLDLFSTIAGRTLSTADLDKVLRFA